LRVGPAAAYVLGVTLPPTSKAALDEIVGRDDPAILGVVLTGSAARGVATEWSDVDVYLVLTEEGYRDRTVVRSPAADEIPTTLAALEAPGPLGSDLWWSRWSFAWARVLRDHTDGRLDAALRRQATLSGQEQRDVLLDRLDAVGNFLYRALKSLREARPFEQRLDVTECVPWALDALFAMEGRVRPYNKYLAWELRTHPLASSFAEPEQFLPRVERMLDGDLVELLWLWDSMRPGCEALDRTWGSGDAAEVFDEWERHYVTLRPLLGEGRQA
jgi:hypothetical protein